MKIKRGRPVLPKGKTKGVLIGARFSDDEAKQVHAAIKLSKTVKSEWIRMHLLLASKAV